MMIPMILLLLMTMLCKNKNELYGYLLAKGEEEELHNFEYLAKLWLRNHCSFFFFSSFRFSLLLKRSP